MAQADREKWDRLHAQRVEPAEPPAWLAEHAACLPRTGRALDIAAGAGRIAIWAAARGLDVLAVDLSGVGLARISHPRVRTLERDLEEDPRLPEGPFELVTLFHYRQPSLAAPVHAALAPGGYLLAELATLTNLERHAHPSRRWLAEPGELLRFAAGLSIEHYAEGWHEDRHTARLVARHA